MGQDEEERWGNIGDPDASQAHKRISRRLLFLLSLPVILVACCGVGAALAFQAWTGAQDVATSTVSSIAELGDLRSKVAREFSPSAGQVSVQRLRQVVRSRRGSEDVTTLEVTLENSPLSEMTEPDRRAQAELVADLVRREYTSIGTVSQICVIVSNRAQTFGFATRGGQRYCWPTGVPQDNSG